MRIYILCHNEQRFKEAVAVYAPYTWAYPIRMKYQDITFENAFWKQLLELKDEWANYQMVGVLSSIAYTKLNIKEVDGVIHGRTWIRDYHNFMDSVPTLTNDHPHLPEIITDVCATVGITPPTTAVCNYWMCTPALMVEFIEWFDARLKPAVMAHPLALIDACYNNGRLTKSDLTLLWGKPYYPHVPFVIERLNKAFFGGKLSPATQKTHYYLLYYNEDITSYTHPNITPLKLSEDNKVFFESRGFLQLDLEALPQVDNIGFITPSFFKKTGIDNIDEICTIELHAHTAIGFFNTEFAEICLHLSKLCHKDTFSVLWNHILQSLDLGDYVGRDFISTYSNMWVMTRANVIKYILFIRKMIAVMKSLSDDMNTLLLGDSDYKGKLLVDNKIQEIIGYPHYTYHTFLCERAIGLFAMINSIKIVNYQGYRLRQQPVCVLKTSPRVLCIMSCHTSSDLKVKAVVHNIKYLKEISDKIIIVDSVECKKNRPIITNAHPDITDIYYISNDIYVCFSKYIFLLTYYDISQYDKIILCNDSFVIVHSLQSFRDLFMQDVDLTSLCTSNETKFHYTDFLRCYNPSSIRILVQYYLDNAHRIKGFYDLITIFEIDSTYLFKQRNVVYLVDETYSGNINFDDLKLEHYIRNGYPIVKIKKLLSIYYINNSIPTDFNAMTYISLNADLSHFNNAEATQHFQTHGWKEGRAYKVSQQSTIPSYLKEALNRAGFIYDA